MLYVLFTLFVFYSYMRSFIMITCIAIKSFCEYLVVICCPSRKREREADRRKKHLRDFDLLKKLAKIVNTPFPITISLVLFLVFVLLFSTRLDGVCPRQSRQKAQPLTQVWWLCATSFHSLHFIHQSFFTVYHSSFIALIIIILHYSAFIISYHIIQHHIITLPHHHTIIIITSFNIISSHHHHITITPPHRRGTGRRGVRCVSLCGRSAAGRQLAHFSSAHWRTNTTSPSSHSRCPHSSHQSSLRKRGTSSHIGGHVDVVCKNGHEKWWGISFIWQGWWWIVRSLFCEVTTLMMSLLSLLAINIIFFKRRQDFSFCFCWSAIVSDHFLIRAKLLNYPFFNCSISAFSVSVPFIIWSRF